jgi:hypothetical protein
MEFIKQIIDTFLPNALLIGAMLFFVLVSIGAKVGSGIYKNVFTLDQKWDWKVFLGGILRGIIFGASIFGVALVISGVPIVLSQAGMLTDAFSKALSNTAMLLILATACVLNIKDAYVNYQSTLNVSEAQIQEYTGVAPTPDAGSEG